MLTNNRKVVVILGPTSSGKSEAAIRLAKKFNGEIISADSRQIYRGMDVGTGKVPSDSSKCKVQSAKLQFKVKNYFSSGIRHHMIDIISPRTNFSAAQFKKKADKIIANILKRGKLPIICGGTGFWIKAIVDDVVYPEVKPNPELRDRLGMRSTEELFNELNSLDPERAKTIDAKNKVRLIRAIEICKAIGKVPKPVAGKNFFPLQIGILIPREKLHENIQKRLEQRFQEGMIEEVEKLHKIGKISWRRLESFGLGYALIPKYLRGEIKTEEELFEKVFQAEKDYAKRQMTWFKKDKRIVWLDNYLNIEREVNKFI